MPFGNVSLNDGNELPLIAFGTGSALFNQDATEAVERALEAGFDHIDTAAVYNNEESVGVAIKDSDLSRDDFYLTTKFDGGDIKKAIQDSLKKLGVKYVDLYLIHFPKLVAPAFENAWREFEQIKADGLARSIGVSNFGVLELRELLKTAHIIPAVNQIRLHPYNYVEQAPVIAYCKTQGIQVAAYSALSSISRTPGGPVDRPVSVAAKRIGGTPAQVLLLWARSKGAAIVTTTSKKERLKEYLDTADLPELTLAEIAAIDAAGALGPPKNVIAKWTGRLVATAVLGAYGAWSFGYLKFC